MAEFLMTEWDGGGSLSPAAVRPEESVSRRMVCVVPLDTYVVEQRLPAPTFVKIDVEGFELEVIDGMVSTIERCMPTLLYEVGRRHP